MLNFTVVGSNGSRPPQITNHPNTSKPTNHLKNRRPLKPQNGRQSFSQYYDLLKKNRARNVTTTSTGSGSRSEASPPPPPPHVPSSKNKPKHIRPRSSSRNRPPSAPRQRLQVYSNTRNKTVVIKNKPIQTTRIKTPVPELLSPATPPTKFITNATKRLSGTTAATSAATTATTATTTTTTKVYTTLTSNSDSTNSTTIPTCSSTTIHPCTTNNPSSSTTSTTSTSPNVTTKTPPHVRTKVSLAEMNWTPTNDFNEWGNGASGPDSPAFAAWDKQDAIFEQIYNRPREEPQRNDNVVSMATTKTSKIGGKPKKQIVEVHSRYSSCPSTSSNSSSSCWQQKLKPKENDKEKERKNKEKEKTRDMKKEIDVNNNSTNNGLPPRQTNKSHKAQKANKSHKANKSNKCMASPSTRLFQVVRETPRTKRGDTQFWPKRRIVDLAPVSKMKLDVSNIRTKGGNNGNGGPSTSRTNSAGSTAVKRRPHSAR